MGASLAGRGGAAPFDMEPAKKAIRLNSATQLAVTKLDVVFPESARVCVNTQNCLQRQKNSLKILKARLA